MKEFTAGTNDGGQRIDKFLQKAVPRLPKSLMYKYLRTKRIKLNGKRAEPQTILARGDVLSLYIND
ncbi:MAG: RluA family pseudouridine synthase, partial [Oscillospiraceae bacterium]|nr:RluA family pseudouridine synthase [Oscillospiraceae bacterium]